MYFCYNCGEEFETPVKTVERHNLPTPPYELLYLCPYCKSNEFFEKNRTHCRCCGALLKDGQKDYCSHACRKKGKLLWEKQVRKRQIENLSALSLLINEIERYNKKHGTNYSYGQYVALIKPKKGKKECTKKRKIT